MTPFFVWFMCFLLLILFITLLYLYSEQDKEENK